MLLNLLRKAALLSLSFVAMGSNAQLSTNPDKFLGNITTSGSVNGGGIEFSTLWNQITPENESKWGSVQGSNQTTFNWGGVDNCVNYAKNHKFPFKFHCFIWGSQYPGWINSLNHYEKRKAIDDWFTAAKTRYSSLDMIDVVNEAVAGHQKDTPVWYEPLGGQGASGFDWIVKAFEIAHEKWPNAILIYNDFNTFRWNTDQFIDLVTKLRDAGAPIDAYGCQSHDLTGCSATDFRSSMVKIQNALKMPMYITEYDIGNTDDDAQKRDFAAQFPIMWEADYCAGVTLWGYIYGKTWIDLKGANDVVLERGISGLIKNGVERPALTWLREYMATDKAKNAKSPFPGMKKPISLYIKPAKYKAPINEPNLITVDATMHNGTTIEKVELYVNNTLKTTMTEAPYTYEVTPTNTTTKVSLKAIVYTSDGKTYERYGGFYGSKWSQHPYTDNKEPLELPGVLEAENFDKGGEMISYHTSRTTSYSTKYRDDQEKTPVYTGAEGGYYLKQPNNGDWFDYTVNVTKATLNYEAIVGTTLPEGSGITMLIYKDGNLKKQTDIKIPYTGADAFTKITGAMGMRFSKGVYKLRFIYDKGNASLDKMYIGVTEEEALGIEDINNQPEESLYTVYSVNGTIVGQIEAQDNADAASEIRNLTNTAGIYIIKNNTSGKSKTIAVK